MWYRIFAAREDMPAPDSLRAFLGGRYASVSLKLAADDSGWYQANLHVDGVVLRLERYVADEPGIRAELNSWAAWLETRENAPDRVRLMERMIQTAQLLTLHGDEKSARSEEIGIALCRYFAETTAGMYQIDERGLFAADGRLLVAE